MLTRISALLLAVTVSFAPSAHAQTVSNLAALEGLAPVSALERSARGRAALAANLQITLAIQHGTAREPLLEPFAAQQEQSLRDAFVTASDAFDLADGLGSTLGRVYQSATRDTRADGGKPRFTNLSPAVARLIIYAAATAYSDSAVAKHFFANATLDGRTAASSQALAIFKVFHGIPDIFGRAYGLPAGSIGARGNPRPFLTAPHLTTFQGRDFFGLPLSNIAYLRGPKQDLINSPSYPSGHTTYGYTESLLLALLVPERYPQMVVRAAEYGNDRIIIGAHYVMDVIAGRTLAEHDLAQLLAGKAGYVGVKRHQILIEDFDRALRQARVDFRRALVSGCRGAMAACARADDSRFAHPRRNHALYEFTQTYGLPVVFPRNAKHIEDVGKLAPEAGYLLSAAFPYLTLARADAILTATEGPGGGFLDNGSAFGVYSRLDLYRASEAAIALARAAAGSVRQ